MEIYTERLILRGWTSADAESLYEYAKNPNVGPKAGWREHKSVEESFDIIENILSAEEVYAICLKSDNIAIGCISLMLASNSKLNLPIDEGEIGYWIGEPFWGRGFVSEACAAIINHSFEDLKLKRLWCGYFEGNIGSKRVQEKCGFTYHHTIKDIFWEPLGELRTEHINCLEKAEK